MRHEPKTNVHKRYRSDTVPIFDLVTSPFKSCGIVISRLPAPTDFTQNNRGTRHIRRDTNRHIIHLIYVYKIYDIVNGRGIGTLTRCQT